VVGIAVRPQFDFRVVANGANTTLSSRLTWDRPRNSKHLIRVAGLLEKLVRRGTQQPVIGRATLNVFD
jgi:hypothetical protein